MPSNRNNGKRSPRKPLDTEVSMELEEFEYNFCKYVDTAMPRKFRDTYVKQILAALGEAARHTLKGLRHDAALFAGEKLYQFGEALSELDYVSTRLNRMNDMQTLSDATKAQLDMKLYDIKDGICFTIEKPALREVIAADFTDKMVQTWYCEKVMPMLEARYLHPDSYACRVGKGGLRAVLRLQDYMFEASNGYTTDVWLAKVDFKGFFMSIDTKTATNELSEFIVERTDGELRNWLLWMTRIIYLSQPQLHCRMQSPMWMEYQLPEHKRMLGREGYEGIAIGNRTSQMLALFRTTFFLSLLVGMGYKFVLYTDDCCVVVTDKAKWLADRRRLALMVREKGLTLHPDKVYLQHYSKGVEMLGYKLRFGRMLPSDRIVHNFKWKTQCAARRLEARANWYDLEGLQQTVNSYLGLLGWCNSYRLRRDMLETLKNGVCGRFYDFAEDYTKITIKTPYKRVMHFVRANNERKRSYKLWLKS